MLFMAPFLRWPGAFENYKFAGQFFKEQATEMFPTNDSAVTFVAGTACPRPGLAAGLERLPARGQPAVVATARTPGWVVPEQVPTVACRGLGLARSISSDRGPGRLS